MHLFKSIAKFNPSLIGALKDFPNLFVYLCSSTTGEFQWTTFFLSLWPNPILKNRFKNINSLGINIILPEKYLLCTITGYK